MKNMKLGIQMWSFNDVCVNGGFEKVFASISKMGYQGFEFCLGSDATLKEKCHVTPDEIKRMLEAYGLEAIGCHISLDRYIENPDPIVEECLELGIPYVAIMPAFYADRATFSEQKERYAKAVECAKRFRESGIQPQVHCAAYGYLKDYQGRMVSLAMFEEAGLENLQPEFDTAWMVVGGLDPADYIRRYSGHVDVLHLKDYQYLPQAEYLLVRHNTIFEKSLGRAVGEDGVLDLPGIVDAAEESGTKWLCVELWNEPEDERRAKVSADNILSLVR